MRSESISTVRGRLDVHQIKVQPSVSRADMKAVRTLLKLVDSHGVDQLVVGPISIVKTRHGMLVAKAASKAKGEKDTPDFGTPRTDPPESVEELDAEIMKDLGIKS